MHFLTDGGIKLSSTKVEIVFQIEIFEETFADFSKMSEASFCCFLKKRLTENFLKVNRKLNKCIAFLFR